MKIKIKIFALAVALGMLLAVPILTGCEKGNRDAGGNAEPETYTVTFISDGGTAVSAQTVKEGEKATKPADPIKTVVVNGTVIDYEFSGWYSGETLWNFETMKVTQDTVLTAKWTQDYTPPYLPTN